MSNKKLLISEGVSNLGLLTHDEEGQLVPTQNPQAKVARMPKTLPVTPSHGPHASHSMQNIEFSSPWEFVGRVMDKGEQPDSRTLDASVQLSLLAAVHGYDRNLMREAMATLMGDIICGKTMQRTGRRRQPTLAETIVKEKPH